MEKKKTDAELLSLFASKIIFALKYLHTRSSGSVMMVTDKATGKVTCKPWVDDFCDALQEGEIEIDRDALDKIRNPRKRTSPKRKSKP